MKKNKLFTIAGSLVMASTLLAPSISNAEFGIGTSGASCEAANLNQANRGIGWSQDGVTNNSTSSFFVVCPALSDWNKQGGGEPQSIIVGATFPGSGTIECTARAQDIFDASYTSISFTVSAGQSSPSNINYGFSDGIISFAASINATVVCALDPGEGIKWTLPGNT